MEECMCCFSNMVHLYPQVQRNLFNAKSLYNKIVHDQNSEINKTVKRLPRAEGKNFVHGTQNKIIIINHSIENLMPSEPLVRACRQPCLEMFVIHILCKLQSKSYLQQLNTGSSRYYKVLLILLLAKV